MTKKSSILSFFLIFSLLSGTVPFKAAAQTYATTHQLTIPDTSVLPDFTQLGGYGSSGIIGFPLSVPFLIPPTSLDVDERGNFSHTLSQKTFSFSSQNTGVLGAFLPTYYSGNMGCDSISIAFAYNTASFQQSIGDEGGSVLPCVPADAGPPTPENTQFVPGIRLQGIVQTYQTPPILHLIGGKMKSDGASPGMATVESIPGDPDNVKVTLETGVRAESYAVRYKRFGVIGAAYPGYFAFDPDTTLHKDGWTYVIYWTTDWTGAPFCDSEGGCTYTGDTGSTWQSQVIQLDVVDESAANSISRPRNSDIVFTTDPKCGGTQWSEGFWETKIKDRCVTFGLSADGRLGTAVWETEQTWGPGWGADLVTGVAIVALTAVGAGYGVPFGEVIVGEIAGITVSQVAVTAATSLASSPVFNALTAINLLALQQVASLSGRSNLGTVETSNNLGVGTWTWSPLPEIPAATCGPANDVPATSAPASGLCGSGSPRTVELACYGYADPEEFWGDCNSREFIEISEKKWQWSCGGNGYRSAYCTAPYDEVAPPVENPPPIPASTPPPSCEFRAQ